MYEYEDPFVKRIKSIAKFPVDVVELDGYPDVIFEIIFEKRIDRSMIENVLGLISDYVENYNKRHFIRPIHYISDIDSLPGQSTVFSFCVHIDFGSASPKSFVGVVKVLADAGLPIYRLVLQ